MTDGPFAEAKDVVGGYTLVEASNMDQAVELFQRAARSLRVDGSRSEARHENVACERTELNIPFGASQDG